MKSLFQGVYTGKRVLVTGHTGFKGSWLLFWLKQMGAEVFGYSLPMPGNETHLGLLDLAIEERLDDLANIEALTDFVDEIKPDIVFHLAAQPLVRYSYLNPVETFRTNVLGLVNLLEACRKSESIRAFINVTSDKCYENREWVWGYRENDPMGGYDPYSSSKGCAELITASYRNSFFNNIAYGKEHSTLVASCRAGNVIGGGDWAEDRLVPDIMKAVNQGEKVHIRSPHATRPWQHVLEPLSGYLNIGMKLLQKEDKFADAWNFGPADEGSISVQEVVENVKKYWNKIDCEIVKCSKNPHEANLLKLDCSKAHTYLGWRGVWNADKTFERTVCWYRSYYEENVINTLHDLQEYINDAKTMNLPWTLS